MYYDVYNVYIYNAYNIILYSILVSLSDAYSTPKRVSLILYFFMYKLHTTLNYKGFLNTILLLFMIMILFKLTFLLNI